MARPQAKFPEDTLEIIKTALKEAKSSPETKRIQCILFRVKFAYTAKLIGEMVGYSETHVNYIWNKYITEGIQGIIGEKRGGRYNENMTIEEENEFVKSFDDKAKGGGILIVSEIKKKYEKEIGKKAHKSVIYKLLHRHNWRKLAPRPSHPKVDLEEQQKFKDAFSPRGKKGLHGSRKSRIKT